MENYSTDFVVFCRFVGPKISWLFRGGKVFFKTMQFNGGQLIRKRLLNVRSYCQFGPSKKSDYVLKFLWEWDEIENNFWDYATFKWGTSFLLNSDSSFELRGCISLLHFAGSFPLILPIDSRAVQCP